MNTKASHSETNHRQYGVYVVKDLDAYDAGLTDPDNKDHYYIKYIGSTHLHLIQLEHNHREETHFFNKKTGKKDIPIKMTHFRNALRERGKRWVFEWLIEPRDTNEYSILIDEGVMIRHYKPGLNKRSAWGQNPLLPKVKHIPTSNYIGSYIKSDHYE
jgi:hypothetical protein